MGECKCDRAINWRAELHHARCALREKSRYVRRSALPPSLATTQPKKIRAVPDNIEINTLWEYGPSATAHHPPIVGGFVLTTSASLSLYPRGILCVVTPVASNHLAPQLVAECKPPRSQICSASSRHHSPPRRELSRLLAGRGGRVVVGPWRVDGPCGGRIPGATPTPATRTSEDIY